MKIIRDNVGMVRFTTIKCGQCFVHEKGVYIKDKWADQATNLLDGDICSFNTEVMVRPVTAKVVIEDENHG